MSTPEERTVCRENTAEVAEWCGGWRAGGANELVGFKQSGETVYARPGDVIHRDESGKFSIRHGGDLAEPGTRGWTV